MITKTAAQTEEIACYVDGCTDHQDQAPAKATTALEQAAAWTTWDYVGTD